MSANTDNPNVAAQVIGMIERCPSGSYTFTLGENASNFEPDYPKQIGVITEMTDLGEVMSVLWVTGGIPIGRADGLPMEIRNRVTLC